MLPVKVAQSTVDGKIRHGHKTVGASAVALSGISVSVKRGVLIRAPGGNDPVPNTATVWIGGGSHVTADSDTDTGGFPLIPGATVVIDTDDVAKIYAISTAAGQDLAWIGV